MKVKRKVLECMLGNLRMVLKDLQITMACKDIKPHQIEYSCNTVKRVVDTLDDLTAKKNKALSNIQKAMAAVTPLVGDQVKDSLAKLQEDRDNLDKLLESKKGSSWSEVFARLETNYDMDQDEYLKDNPRDVYLSDGSGVASTKLGTITCMDDCIDIMTKAGLIVNPKTALQDDVAKMMDSRKCKDKHLIYEELKDLVKKYQKQS